MHALFNILPGAERWGRAGRGARAATGVVVVHGFTGNARTTRPIGEALAARGFTVEVLRLPGHGTHWRDLARTRYRDWKRAVEAAVDALAPRVERVILVGLSMGGALALDVGSGPKEVVAGVVAINAPYLDREGLLARLAPLVARVIPAVPASAAGLVKNDAARAGVDEMAYPMVPARAAQSLLDALPRIRVQLSAMRRPVLVAFSPADHSVPAANSEALLAALGDTAEALVLPRSYHLAPLDLDAELLFERVAAFADRVAASP
jgi:carboxylesterase